MNRKKKLLPMVLTLTLFFSSFLINIYAHGETEDPSAQNTVVQTSSEVNSAATSAPETPTSSPATSTPPSSKPLPSSRKTSSKVKKRVKRVSARQSSSAVSSSTSSESSVVPKQESSSISLPSVGSIPEDNSLNSLAGNDETNNRTSWVGIISWACIVLGVLVIVVVLLSNRRPPRGPGRKRYRRPKRRKKHLLNDKYYRGINRY